MSGPRIGAWYPAAYAAGLGLGYVALPFSRKLRRGLLGRQGLTSRLRRAAARWSERPVWFHVASSGELESALPIMEALKARHPHVPLFVSYFSPSCERAIDLETARRKAAGRAVPWDYADFSPHDWPGAARAALDAMNPRALVSIHREVWPAILREAARRGIPRYLFAAYFPRDWQPKSYYLRWMRYFDAIGTTGEDSTQRARSWLGDELPPVSTLGDPRIERVLERKRLKPQAHWAQHFDPASTVVLASIWPCDIAALGASLDSLVLEGALRLVAVPHEPTPKAVRELQDKLRAGPRAVRVWSEWARSPDRDSHLVVDGVGLLAELYRVAGAVFVGNSFGPRVHNVLEPAAYGAPIFTGPSISNSGEACELRRLGLLAIVAPGGQFADEVRLLLRDAGRRTRWGNELQAYLETRSGSGARYADRIDTLLVTP